MGAVVLAVVGAVVAQVARWQAEALPTVYTFVSEFQVPRASWAQYAEDTEKNFVPIAEKLMADGSILGYETFESVVHTPDGYTHGAAWQAHSMAGLLKVLDEVRKNGPQNGQLAATKHQDLLLQSSLYAGAQAGKTSSGYLRVLCQMTPADNPDAYGAALKKIFWPTFEEQLRIGAVDSIRVDQQYINNGPQSLRCLAITYRNAEGLDSWTRNVGAVLEKLSPSERATFFATTVPDTRRDFLARLTHYHHQSSGHG
jgi:hypothetical protein